MCLQVPAAADPVAANKSDTASPRSEDIWKRDTLTGDWGGVGKSLEDRGLTFSVNEVSEVWANLAGGERTGATYDGLTTASLKLDLAKLLSWQATVLVNNEPLIVALKHIDVPGEATPRQLVSQLLHKPALPQAD